MGLFWMPYSLPYGDISELPDNLITAETPGRAWLCITGSDQEAPGGGHWSLLLDFGLWNPTDGNHALSSFDFVGMEMHLGLQREDSQIRRSPQRSICEVMFSVHSRKWPKELSMYHPIPHFSCFYRNAEKLNVG